MGGGRLTSSDSGAGTAPTLPAPTLELVCSECGYGVIVRRVPPICPLCGQGAWDSPGWRPFTRRPELPPAA